MYINSGCLLRNEASGLIISLFYLESLCKTQSHFSLLSFFLCLNASSHYLYKITVTLLLKRGVLKKKKKNLWRPQPWHRKSWHVCVIFSICILLSVWAAANTSDNLRLESRSASETGSRTVSPAISGLRVSTERHGELWPLDSPNSPHPHSF